MATKVMDCDLAVLGAGGLLIDSVFPPTGLLTWAVCSGYMAGIAAGEYLRRVYNRLL
jgi:hypothetical protein